MLFDSCHVYKAVHKHGELLLLVIQLLLLVIQWSNFLLGGFFEKSRSNHTMYDAST